MGCNHDCEHCSSKCGDNKKKSLLEKPNKYSSVKKIIAVVSGKGGVGKSMVTALLASLMNKRGYKTGILDADITGPSIPRMFGVTQKGQGTSEGLLPSPSKNNIKIMSSHLLLEHDNDPIVWRGTLISGLVRQFWTDVIWEDVDYLFVDMPPGTGDVPLTVFQSIGVDGIIIVTSPQELVQMIVEKACKMANMMNIPIIGIVENMSYIECPDCKKKIEVFGHSTVDAIASKFGLDVLAKMPIDHVLSELSDRGNIEDAKPNYLDKALDTLESLPVNVLNIAVPVDDDKITNNLEDAKVFFVYNIVKQMVVGGHKAIVGSMTEIYPTLKEHQVHTILCDKVNPKFCTILEEDGFEVFVDCKGNPLDNVQKYLSMEDEDDACDGDCEHCSSKCDHHDHCDCGDDCSCDCDDCNEQNCDGDCEYCKSKCK